MSKIIKHLFTKNLLKPKSQKLKEEVSRKIQEICKIMYELEGEKFPGFNLSVTIANKQVTYSMNYKNSLS